jgi:glycosyltransferase involved in cell wall biosynthesis
MRPETNSGVDSLAICIATFRRPEGLRRLLAGIAAQTYRNRPPPRVRVVVVDNEASAQTEALCRAAATDLGLALQYVAEPRTGIPYARNAALDAVTSSDDWLCFIDDDEVPSESWLESLRAAQKQTGAECVAGRVVPVFPPETPRWIVNGAFFGSRKLGTGTRVPSTSNTMISRAAVSRLGLRFDTDFGGSGGDDTLFFRRAVRGGVRVFWADAVVHEHVVPGRLRFSRILRRQFREGCTLAQCDLAMGATWSEKVVRFAKGVWLLVLGVFSLPLCLVRGLDALAYGACRFARGLGTFAGLAGMNFEEYRPDRNRDL